MPRMDHSWMVLIFPNEMPQLGQPDLIMLPFLADYVLVQQLYVWSDPADLQVLVESLLKVVIQITAHNMT